MVPQKFQPASSLLASDIVRTGSQPVFDSYVAVWRILVAFWPVSGRKQENLMATLYTL